MYMRDALYEVTPTISDIVMTCGEVKATLRTAGPISSEPGHALLGEGSCDASSFLDDRRLLDDDRSRASGTDDPK
jgi:hypothetical protein